MKRFSFCLLILAAAMASLSGRSGTVSAENLTQKAAGDSEAFRTFSENAEGRYFTSDAEGTEVLELVPAFGRLFASVGKYMGESSLYSYYAAELIPVCAAGEAGCSGNASASSFDFTVRLYSNMSMAGTYWPGETRQRLTLIPGGLLLSDHSGDGDALISKSSALLERNDDVPGMFPYGAAEAKRMTGNEENSGIPGTFEGTLSASWEEYGNKTDVRISLSRNGSVILLRDRNDGYPPLLLKGGFSVASEETSGSRLLCWLMSSPASGMMPYSGCVKARTENGALILSRTPENDGDPLLPDNAAEMVYVRDRLDAEGR